MPVPGVSWGQEARIGAPSSATRRPPQTHFHPKGRGGDGAWVVLMLRDDEDSNEDQDGLRLSISFVESLTPMKVGQCHCKLKAGDFGTLGIWKTLEYFGRSCST